MTEPQLADNELVAAIVAGDQERFGELMGRYESKLVHYVVYLIHDRSAAQDIVQETFIKTYKNLRGFNAKYKFSSWIYRIAHNEAMSYVRHEKHLDHDTDIDIVREIDRSILRDKMSLCLDEIDARYREVLMLQFYEGMKYDEIADVLRVPPSTVGVWALRGKAKLKELCERKGVTP
jgi:RNA polymerase sigma-70 factor (ECF subfamily)